MTNTKGMTHKEIELFKGFKTKAKNRQLTSMIRSLMTEITKREDLHTGIVPDGYCPECQEFLNNSDHCPFCGWPERKKDS